MSKLVVFPSDPIEAYLKKGFDYKYLGEYYNPGGFFDEVFALTVWGEQREWKENNISYIKSDPRFFKRIISDIHPDVIRGYGGSLCAEIAQFTRIKDIPVIISVHDSHPDTMVDALRYSDYLICMSEVVKKNLMDKIPFDENNIFVMPNRIDENLFQKTFDKSKFEELNSRFKGKKHILHVGRKVKQKNLDTLIRAMKNIDKDVSVIFVGQGDTTPYRQIVAETGVADRCFFVDRVDKKDLPIWYSWCDCFCTPSRWEGFGFVFIEAAGCEAGIVTSDISPMNEYLTNEKDAILVKDHEDPICLAEAVNRVLLGGEDIDRMKKEARKVGMRFSKEIIDKEEVSIYKSAMLGGSRNDEPGIMKKLKYMKHARMYYKGKL